MGRRIGKTSVLVVSGALIVGTGCSSGSGESAGTVSEGSITSAATAAESTVAATTSTVVATTSTAADGTVPPDDTAAPATTEAPSSGAVAQPVTGGSVDAGTWTPAQWMWPMSFTVEEPWDVVDLPKAFTILEQLPTGSAVGPGEVSVFALPEMSTDEAIAAIREPVGITWTDPEPASIAGLDGFVLTSDGGESGSIAYPVFSHDPNEFLWFVFVDTKNEVYVLERPEGTMLLWIDAPARTWDTFRPEAQELIDTFLWTE